MKLKLSLLLAGMVALSSAYAQTTTTTTTTPATPSTTAAPGCGWS